MNTKLTTYYQSASPKFNSHSLHYILGAWSKNSFGRMLNLVGAAMVSDLTEKNHRLRGEAMPIGLSQLDALRQS